MMPRPMTPTGSRLVFLLLCCERTACRAEARLALCRERWPGVEVAIVFLEGNGRVEHRADVVRGEHLAFRPGRGNPAVADQNDPLNLGDDFLDVMRAEDERASGP